MDRHRKRCDLALGYIVSPALDNAQRTVFLEDGCRLVGVLLELLAVGRRHCGYESVDVGHDVSPITSGCSVTLAIYCRLKRFSRPIGQRYACVVSFPAPVASTALTILAQRLLYSLGRRHQTLCDKFSRNGTKCVNSSRCSAARAAWSSMAHGHGGEATWPAGASCRPSGSWAPSRRRRAANRWRRS